MNEETNKKSRAVPAAKRSKKIAIVILSLLLCIALFVLSHYIGLNKQDGNEDHEGPVIDVTDDESPVVISEERLRQLQEYEAINKDYVGQIVFDSGLIDLPFVQAKEVYDENGKLYKFYDENGHLVTDPTGYTGNDVYIWTNWKTGKYDYSDEGGSVFMDCRNELTDQNLIIYGHHYARDWDPSGTKQFTPLDALLQEENYQQNKTLKLYLENEVRSYVVTNIFIVDIYNEKHLQMFRTDMSVDFYKKDDPDFFESYIPYIDSLSKYDTKEPLNKNDRILTLVTCIQHQPQYRQIILCKQTNVETFETDGNN
ncbi:MAG: class B sortase [Erysipelotrichaceae bacterium]|nr:class B sortase [Erysipelotrichaceae bacterium]